MCSSVFFFTIRPPPRPTLFPYTTLFRSRRRGRCRAGGIRGASLRGEGSAPRLLDVGPARATGGRPLNARSEEHTSELQSLTNLVCRLLLEKKKNRSAPQQTRCVSGRCLR